MSSVIVIVIVIIIDTHMGLLIIQYSVSSVIQGLLGPTPTNKGSQSMKVSVYLMITMIMTIMMVVVMMMMMTMMLIMILTL